jgi:uncharacterized protein (DUF1778 family)
VSGFLSEGQPNHDDACAPNQAALLNNKTRADFILEAATRAAQDSVLDQVLFPVPVEQFEAFQRLQESSPEQDKRLSALMARTSRWGK